MTEQEQESSSSPPATERDTPIVPDRPTFVPDSNLRELPPTSTSPEETPSRTQRDPSLEEMIRRATHRPRREQPRGSR